jgi:hypothetical protein
VRLASRVCAWRSRCAILATAATRSPICCRVNPSGKTTWNGFAIAITVSTVPVAVVRVTVRYTSVLELVVGGSELVSLPPPIAATASQPSPPSSRADAEREQPPARDPCAGSGRSGGRPRRGGITPCRSPRQVAREQVRRCARVFSAERRPSVRKFVVKRSSKGTISTPLADAERLDEGLRLPSLHRVRRGA